MMSKFTEVETGLLLLAIADLRLKCARKNEADAVLALEALDEVRAKVLDQRE
jgi:hypothetical protein